MRQGADEGLRSGRAKERPAAHAGLHARAWQGAQLAMSLAIHKGGHLRPDTRFKERYPSPPRNEEFRPRISRDCADMEAVRIYA